MKVKIIGSGTQGLSSRNKKFDLRKLIVWISVGIITLFLFGILSVGLTIAFLSAGLPNVHDIDKLFQTESTTIYDKNGAVLYVKPGADGENRKYVTYDEISPYVIDATVAIEDDQYWDHPGFDLKGIIRAVVNNVSNPDAKQGGSTITQQYIKKAFLTSEKSLTRKFQELILAVQLEQAFDKKKILELYLNKIFYGNNAYGIEKASQVYFNKHVKDLTLAESVILAALPNAPTYYNPFGSHRYSTLTKQFSDEELKKRNIQEEKDLKDDEFMRGLIGKNVEVGDHEFYIQGRTDLILKTMVDFGYITESQKKDALDDIKRMVFQKTTENAFEAQHFVEYVIKELEKKWPDELAKGGLRVYTTLDLNLQKTAQQVIKDGTELNSKKFNAKNGALLSMDPRNGQIIAMVGSRDYFDPIYGQHNVAVDSYRAPGSSFKPFVYAQAFYNRYSPASVVFDTSTKFEGNFPKNFDGKFWGPMSVRRALGQSRNIPAIKAYYVAGEKEPIIQLAQKMGIKFQQKSIDDIGYSLALGAAEVRLIDMVTAFSVFANGGIYHEPVAITKIESGDGQILYQWQENEGKPVLDPQVAYLINSILSDKDVRLSPNLTIPNQINAAKTGTSNITVNGKYYSHDLWAMGYTTKLVTGVWNGNNDNKLDGYIPASADGSTVAAPIWKKFMTEALKNSPAEEFPVPKEIKPTSISIASAKLPGPNTPQSQVRTDVFASFAIPTEIDDSYNEIEIDALCNKLANEFTPDNMKTKGYFVNIPDLASKPEWQEANDKWLKANPDEAAKFLNTSKSMFDNPNIFVGAPPTESCSERTAQSQAQKPTISITSPANGSTFSSGSKVKVEVETQTSSPSGIDKVEFYLDDQMKYRSTTSPYQAEIRLPIGENGTVHHTITVKAFDKLGYTGETSVGITVGE